MELNQLSQQNTKSIEPSLSWIYIGAEIRSVDAMNEGVYDDLPV
jgi:hypothetical protein